MVTEFFTSLAIGTTAAAVSIVFTRILASEWFILIKWQELLGYLKRSGWPDLILNPLGACSKCFAGQVALWSTITAITRDFADGWGLFKILCVVVSAIAYSIVLTVIAEKNLT